MIKYLCLAAGLVLATSTAAQACSPEANFMSQVQDYSALSSNRHANWKVANISVGLVYVKKKRHKNRKGFIRNGHGEIKKPYVKVKYQLIEDISGGFVPNETEWYPEISSRIAKNERKIKTKPRRFKFWDRADLTVPLVTGYRGETSCGPIPSTTLLADEYYLHFKKGDKTIGLEIVSGPEDDFVANWREVYSGGLETKIARRPKNYFLDMSGYQVIELEKCPNKGELDLLTYGDTQFFGPIDMKSLSYPKIFRAYSDHKSDIEDLKFINLFTYQNALHGGGWQCRAGRQYLVLDKRSPRTYRGYQGMFSLPAPQHRYLEITDGHIDTKDILSQINILDDEKGSTRLDVSQIKSWIKEANPED